MAEPTWDLSTFSRYYVAWDRRPGSPTNGQGFTYGREWAKLAAVSESPGIEFYDARWAMIASQFGISTTTDRILIVGCGLGFLIEAAKAAGFPNTYGLDNSAYLEGLTGDIDPASIIVWADIRGGGSVRAQLRNQTGDDEFQWIITEDVVACYDDADILGLVGAAEAVLAPGTPTSHIIHCTTVGDAAQHPGEPNLNWKSIDAWAALVPTHSWISTLGEVPA